MIPFAEKKLTSELDQGQLITACTFLSVNFFLVWLAATFYDPVVIILSNVHMMGRKNISQEGIPLCVCVMRLY